MNESVNTDTNTKSGLSLHICFAGIAAAQWLGLRLQSIAAFVITLVALLAVLGHQGLLPFAVSDGKFAASESADLMRWGCFGQLIVRCTETPAFWTQDGAWQMCIKTCCRHAS